MHRRHWPILFAALALAAAAAASPQTGEAQPAVPEGARARYLESCASCHGAAGKGDGEAGALFPVRPRDFTDAKYMAGLSDEYLGKIIALGGAAVGKAPFMPGFGALLTQEEIDALVAYIRSLARG